MDEPEWWPSGIAQTSVDQAISEGVLRTSFGKTSVWNVSAALEPEWWNTLLRGRSTWGEWPTRIDSVSLVESISARRNEVVVCLNQTILASLIPIDRGDDVSRVVRHEPWFSRLQDQPILLPKGGWSVEGNDRILLYPMYEKKTVQADPSDIATTVSDLSSLHSSLADEVTPSTERRWNERLKAVEDKLKTNTMWRAPHSSTTLGLPRLHLDIDSIVEVDGKQMFLPLCRTLSEHLLCESDRLPSLASLMMLEHQWARKDGLSEQQRQNMLETWSRSVPSSWSSRSALSTVRGGAWVWRYHATVLELAQAKAFADETTVKACEQWLREVSRLQAYLGTLRMWKSGQWVGITGLIVSFFAWKLETLTPNQSFIVALLSFGLGLATNFIYRAKDPKPY
jgi:hypothetical protein